MGSLATQRNIEMTTKNFCMDKGGILCVLVFFVAATAAAGPCSPGADGRVAMPSFGFVQLRALVQELNITDNTVRTVDEATEYIYDDVRQVYSQTYTRSVFETSSQPWTTLDAHMSASYADGYVTTRWTTLFGSNSSERHCSRAPRPYINGSDLSPCKIVATNVSYGFFDDAIVLQCMDGPLVSFWVREVGAQCIIVASLLKQSFDGINYVNRQYYAPLQPALSSSSAAELMLLEDLMGPVDFEAHVPCANATSADMPRPNPPPWRRLDRAFYF